VLVRLSTPCNGFHVENRDQILVLLLFIFQLHVMDSELGKFSKGEWVWNSFQLHVMDSLAIHDPDLTVGEALTFNSM